MMERRLQDHEPIKPTDNIPSEPEPAGDIKSRLKEFILSSLAAVVFIFAVIALLSLVIPSKPAESEPTAEHQDLVLGYLAAIDYLILETRLADRQLDYISIDTSNLDNLSEDSQAELLDLSEYKDWTILNLSLDELEANGYLSDSEMGFESGALIILDTHSFSESTLVLDIRIYYSALNGFGYQFLTLEKTDGTWQVVGSEATIQA